MIKKFVSNALLSVVMDKKARDKLNALNESKSQAKKAKAPSKRAPAESDLDLPRLVPEKAPRRTAAERPAAPRQPAPAAPRPPSPLADDEDPAVLIRQALESAEQELIRKQNRTHKGKPITPEREALIEQAMAIHRSKSHILDDLDQDQRDKLYVMAMQALNDQKKS